MTKETGWDQYGRYLQLGKLLDAQAPWSGNDKAAPAHDEMLFIVFHQTYELWFKQTLFELDDIQKRLSGAIVDDRDMQPIIAHLERIVSIWKILVSQIDILETMTPQGFIDFRESLRTASGFQSLQFRLIETRLGLPRDTRIPVFHGAFDRDLENHSRRAIADAEGQPSLFERLDQWLARTPFVDRADYKFWDSYKKAVHTMLDAKEQMATQTLSGDALETERAAIAKGRRKFDGIFDPALHGKAQEEKLWRMSWKALQSALFITIYRDEPVLQSPARLLGLVMDIDELIARWRYRHALMVQRMMGMSMGTGGSSGYGYLMETLDKHRIFTDLFALSTYLIPAHALPALPESVSRDMGYRYASSS